MKVEFTRRALDDIREAASHSRTVFGHRVAMELGARIQQLIRQLSDGPLSGIKVEQRPGVRIIPLGRYPYRLFYKVSGETVTVLHLRHTARRPWPNIAG